MLAVLAFGPNQRLGLTAENFGAAPDESDPRDNCAVNPPNSRKWMRNLSERGSQIQLREPLRDTSQVKIEYADRLLLREVVYCRAGASWVVTGNSPRTRFVGSERSGLCHASLTVTLEGIPGLQ